MTPYRERDIRNEIHDVLEATGAFDGVYLTGLPEDRGEASSESRAVAIEPAETVQSDHWDDVRGDLLLTCRVNLTVLARHDDPQIRDEMAEMLVNIAANVLNGQSLSGATLVGQTRFKSWSWEKPKAPERRITVVLEYQYLVSDWTGSNTAE